VRCSPLFEIRDNQSVDAPPAAKPPVFGNPGIALHTAPGPGPRRTIDPETISPGPPFHTATATINLVDEPNAYRYVTGTTIQPVHMTSRPKPATPGNGVVSLADSSPQSDMELTPDHTSPATSHRGGSSSHTSFTPDQQHIPSPSMDMPVHDYSNVGTSAQTAPVTTQDSSTFYYQSNDVYAPFNASLYAPTPSADPLNPAFGLQPWGTSGSDMENLMSEEEWTAIPDMPGVHGWDPFGGQV